MSDHEPPGSGPAVGGGGPGRGAVPGAAGSRRSGGAALGTLHDPGPRPPDPRMIPPWPAPSPLRPAAEKPERRPRHAEPSGTGDDLVIRPFLLTGGRTRPIQDGLRVEALVQAQPPALVAPLRFEARRIVETCQQPKSVAEVAADLRLPLGVTRVLVADLVADGCLQLAEQQELSIELIERIRDRVRAL